MRSLITLAAVAGTLWGCAPQAPSRQACVECALRTHPHAAALPDAERTFRRGCDEGDARSCSTLAVMFENGRGVARDERRAASLYGRACRDGNALGCVSLGRMMERGTAARADLDGARTLYRSACDGGELEGCHELGRSLADMGRMGAATKLLGDACRARHAPSCETLGVMTQQGRGIAQNDRRARELFERACLSGRAQACDRL